MALGATIYKISLTVSDLDRHYYSDFELTVARHPSETEERMMMRLAAFALHADERLAFTKGICAEDEPDLWLTDYDGSILLWIDLGQPDEKRIRKACGRAEEVIIYTYVHKAASAWWRQNGAKLSRFANLSVKHLEVEGDVGSLVNRTMALQALIQDGELLLSDDGEQSVKITAKAWE